MLRKSVVDRAFEDDPVEAEYGGRFRQPMTTYLERTVVEKAVDVGVAARTVLPGVTYEALIDRCGREWARQLHLCHRP